MEIKGLVKSLLIAFYACNHKMDNKIVVINHDKQFCVHNYVRYRQCLTEDGKHKTNIQASGEGVSCGVHVFIIS